MMPTFQAPELQVCCMLKSVPYSNAVLQMILTQAKNSKK